MIWQRLRALWQRAKPQQMAYAPRTEHQPPIIIREIEISSQPADIQAEAGKLHPIAEIQTKDYAAIGQAEIVSAGEIHGGNETLHAAQQASIYEKHLWFNTCVHIIASSLRQTQFQLYRGRMINGEEDLEAASDHPVARVFDWWNPYMSASDAWEWITSFLLISGTCYVYQTPKGDQAPADVPFELYPLIPKGLKVVRDREGIAGYIYNLAGHDLRILPEELWTIKTFNPRDRFTGLGRMSAGVQQVRTDIRAREWNENLLKNGVSLSGVLATEESITIEQADEAREAFLSKFASQSNAGRVAVLWNGMQYTPLALSHADIGWLEQLSMDKQDVADAFGVPLELFGKAANYAVMKEKRRLFWEDTVLSYARLIEDSANSTYFPRHDPTLVGRFLTDRVDALKPDKREQVGSAKEAIGAGLLTINEARQQFFSLDPIQGGDVVLVPRNLQTLDAALAEARNAVGDTDNQKQIARLGGPPKASKAASAFRDANALAQARASDDYALSLRELLRDDEEAILRETLKGLGKDELLASANKIIIIDGTKIQMQQAQESLGPHVEGYAKEYARIAGLEQSIDLENFDADQILSRQEKRIIDVSNRRWKDLREQILEGFQEGEYEAKLAARIEDFFLGERRNALTIARTESTAAINGASHKVDLMANEMGVKTYSQWLTSQEGVRDTHIPLDGVMIDPTEELFVVGASELAYPGDPRGQAADVINCKCVAIPIVSKGRA